MQVYTVQHGPSPPYRSVSTAEQLGDEGEGGEGEGGVDDDAATHDKPSAEHDSPGSQSTTPAAQPQWCPYGQ